MAFKNIEIVCENVKDELKEIAGHFDISVSKLDFEILEVMTLISETPGGEFFELDSDMKDKLKSKDYLLNPNLSFQQQYKLLVKQKEKDRTFAPIIKISADKTISSCTVTIYKNSVLPLSNSLAGMLRHEINKKKILNGLLVGLWDEKLKTGVDNLVRSVKTFGSLKEDYKIAICDAIMPKFPILPEIVEIYKKKMRPENEKLKVDYRKRGIYSHVGKGEAVMEFIKGKSGSPGRNCRGEFIGVSDVQKVTVPPFTVDGTLREVDMGANIIYYAEKDGFVKQEDRVVHIVDDIEVDSVNLKETGSIEASSTSNTSLKVVSSSFDEDSVATNMVVESKSVHVEGSVGAKASIRGESVSIEGQTHSSSSISGDKVFIKRSKGDVEGKEISIDVLEGGVVKGENIVIKNAIGGEIYGKAVTVVLCGSNIKVYATESIFVDNIKGENNLFMIDAKANVGNVGDADSIKAEIDLLTKKLRKKEHKVASLFDFIKNNKEALGQVKNFIREAKERGREPNPVLAKRIEDYKKVLDEIKEIQSGMLESKEKIKLQKTILENLQNKIMGSKIELSNGNLTASSVGFRLLNPKLNLSKTPKKNEKIFRIRKENEDYVIVSETE